MPRQRFSRSNRRTSFQPRVRYFAGLVAAILLSTSALATAESVLCFGEDGHVTVEVALDGSCVDRPISTESDAPEFGTFNLTPDRGDHCGECEDLPIGPELLPVSTLRDTHFTHLHIATQGAPAISAPAFDLLLRASHHLRRADSCPAPLPQLLLRGVRLQR